MKKKYNFATVIGRFQPYHIVHHDLLNHALELSQNVIVILGSARLAPDVKNPFTPSMRERMIRSAFDEETQSRLIFRSVRDYPYNENFWFAEVQNAVQSIFEDYFYHNAEENEDHSDFMQKKVKHALVGYFKDATSYYLNSFPQWTFEGFTGNLQQSRMLSATDIREQFFNGDDSWKSLVPQSVVEFIEDFLKTETFDTLKQEFDYIQKYKQDTKFVGVPFTPTFVTTDAVVTAMGHVLVVKRGHQPGKGLLALPGGFLAQHLSLEDNMLKELKEETKIRVPDNVLRGSIKSSRQFDYPFRSLRGRTLTFAYHIELQASLANGLPTVVGGDDADKAFWIPVNSLGEREEEFFEDHIHIIRHFLGIV